MQLGKQKLDTISSRQQTNLRKGLRTRTYRVWHMEEGFMRGEWMWTTDWRLPTVNRWSSSDFSLAALKTLQSHFQTVGYSEFTHCAKLPRSRLQHQRAHITVRRTGMQFHVLLHFPSLWQHNLKGERCGVLRI